MKHLVLALLVATVLVAAGAVLALRHTLGPVDPAAPAVVVEIAPGTPLAAIARQLETAGAVRSARAFAWLARWRGVAGQLHAGEYELRPSEDAEAVLAQLAAGRVRLHRVVVPEGWTVAEIAARLEAAGLADAAAFTAFAQREGVAGELGVEGPGLEGYLFPETYHLARNLEPGEVAAAMVGQFLEVWRPLAPAAAERGLSMREAVTLASIVEKETGLPEERPLIAAVFLNRLRRGMRLETDPTVIYGIPDFDGNLRRVHLEDESNPYNTYRIPGLPPGPIASPGADALRAVVEPAESEYLYFVSRNDGSHVFSRTYREHVNAVRRHQQRRGP